MHKSFLVFGTILGALAVALGAFGAHGLQQLTSNEKTLHGFQTAVQYQTYHALVLIITAFIYEKFPNKLVRWSGDLFIAGIILFSGSLYALTFLKIAESDLVKFVGPITPLGGIFFIAGWLLLFAGIIKKND